MTNANKQQRILDIDTARFRAAVENELVKKKRRLPDDCVENFIGEAVHELAVIAETRRFVQEQMPEGWEDKYDNTQRSLDTFVRGLLHQTAYGRRAIFKKAVLTQQGRDALGGLSSGDLQGDWNATIDTIVDLLSAAAELNGDKAEWRYPNRAQQVKLVVQCLAKLWRSHFQKEPKAADGAPFSDSVIAVWAEMSEGEPLSWKTVGEALVIPYKSG